MAKEYVVKVGKAGPHSLGAVVPSDDPFIKEHEPRLLKLGMIALATDEDKEVASKVETAVNTPQTPVQEGQHG